MEDDDPRESSGSKVLTSEQLQRLQDLQRRRLQIQKKAQSAPGGKTRSKKKAKKGPPAGGESASEEQQASTLASATAQGCGHSQPRVRVDIPSHRFSPSRDPTTSATIAEPKDNLRVEKECKDDPIQGAVGEVVASANQALAVVKQAGTSVTSARRKRKKLHWGLDSKERWERKSNM
ncbi:hypothetical protein MPTK1_6g01470 [Marchantia polymorpha subsp. ruderalis]|uniref:Uncharacterized protein n=2 Tax=Marchantia polymorpha TaxID=3197 RepID=A0AAF6BME9_MARPO|nr:hypothetical protein MARPO_0052s0058 [Marchantia polymorpha]BBN13183.1 hypothetical protein Mp_6g01470 [Marchantia polymorpha subsp. ruderalis]|eukprot:PTQ38266.1 hypothetical protein MARPO_0052s0058 [Marchantia polymorpha]